MPANSRDVGRRSCGLGLKAGKGLPIVAALLRSTKLPILDVLATSDSPFLRLLRYANWYPSRCSSGTLFLAFLFSTERRNTADAARSAEIFEGHRSSRKIDSNVEIVTSEIASAEVRIPDSRNYAKSSAARFGHSFDVIVEPPSPNLQIRITFPHCPYAFVSEKKGVRERAIETAPWTSSCLTSQR